MTKELKIDLFNIYDVVVFADENGITQDCVCVIGKDKEVDEIVDMIECNNHSISIYGNGNYKVWEKDGKGMPYYATNKKIIHLYTLKNDNRFYEVYPTNDYDDVDNSNTSEAMKQVKFFKSQDFYDEIGQHYGLINERCKVIEDALIKAQEQEKVLKIIFEKNVNIIILKLAENVDEYNERMLANSLMLTQEEFDLIRRYLK